MDYAIVIVPVAPVRRKARHEEEMVNQLLFGETVRVTKEKKGNWSRVRGLHDGYEGWVRNNQLQETDEKNAKKPCGYATNGLLNTLQVNGSKMYIPFGSLLRGFVNGQGSIGDFKYGYDGGFTDTFEGQPSAEKVVQLTSAWMNAPYLWGGRTILGIDCSGFVQVNYRMMGLDLPRDAWQQAQHGKTVKKIKEAVCGDLAFFDDKEEIVHVGILLGNEQIIHASGRVRIDSIDKKGIIHSETGKRTHYLQSIKRHW